MRKPWRPAWIAHAEMLWANGLTAPEILVRLDRKFEGFDKSEGSFSNLRNRNTKRFPRRSTAERIANCTRARVARKGACR